MLIILLISPRPGSFQLFPTFLLKRQMNIQGLSSLALIFPRIYVQDAMFCSSLNSGVLEMVLSTSVWAAVSTNQSLGGLWMTELSLSGFWRLEVQDPAACRPLTLCCVPTWKGLRSAWGLFQDHASHSWMLQPHDLSTSERPRLLIPSYRAVRFQTKNFARTHTFRF